MNSEGLAVFKYGEPRGHRRTCAFERLQRAVEERADHLPYLKVNPRLDPLRADPRFGSLLRRMRLDPDENGRVLSS